MVSITQLMTDGSIAAMTFRATWKLPVDGFSAQRTFWMRYGYMSSSLAALGQDILWILMPSSLVTKPNTSSP